MKTSRAKRANSALRLFVGTWLFLLLAAVSPLSAQTDAPLVGEIVIEFQGKRNISDEAMRARIQLREGQPFSQAVLDRSIRTLYDTRFFENVAARTETMDTGDLRVVFTVSPTYRLTAVRLAGNKKLRASRLDNEIKSAAGAPLDERQVQEDIQALLTYYRKKGFTDARITSEIQRDQEAATAELTYRIDEGPRLKIKRVEFVGNEAFSDDDLRDEMKTRRRWFMSWLTGSGRFNEDEFQEDLEKLRRHYLNAGYLDVSIPESEVTLDRPKEGQIIIRIQVHEGRRYRVGEIRFEGYTIYTEAQLFANLDLLSGDWFNPETLDKDVERLTNLYGAFGYLDTRVRVERRANVETGNIDLLFRIQESGQFQVQSVIIEGNTKTKSTVIIRELALAPGRTFNTVFMRNSEARLRNTRFFEEVNLSPEATPIPNRRDLKIRVREARTGNFQFGAGFSSLENLVFFVELSQSNFDLFNWRSSPFLQGDGQKFRIRGSIGSRSNEVVISFEEPWLFERRLAFGVELYRQESDYNSSYYDELRTGITLYLRKRLFGLVDGQFAYTYEVIDFQDVAPNAPTLILREADNSPRSISKVTTTLVRDTRNDLVFTTRGSRISLAHTFAGIGGDTEYMGLELRTAFFLPTFEFGDQVLAILARAGSLWGYSGEDVPFFDRYYLGGPNSLRGFDYRDVSPYTATLGTGLPPGVNKYRTIVGTRPDGTYIYAIQGLAPEGGNTYGFTSLEYSIKLADTLRIAMFYDWGFVNRDEFDFSTRNYHDNWGFGIRLLVLGNPLRLDYGIPINSGFYDDDLDAVLDTDSGGQFNFSFGTRF